MTEEVPKRPLVSIVVPCFNAEGFIAETLSGVQEQTYENWECIVVDDASTDRSARVVEEMAESDSRIRLLELERNGGAAEARNSGLDLVRGEYIAFLDADDYWVPRKLEKQVALSRECGAAIVHSSYRFVDESGSFLPGGVIASDQVDLRKYLRNTEIGMSTSLLDRAQVEPLQFRNIRLCQDTHLWLQLLSRGLISRGLTEPLVHYRVREGQISGSKLAMAKQVFLLWMEVKEVSILERLWSFSCYAINGFRKRRGDLGTRLGEGVKD